MATSNSNSTSDTAAAAAAVTKKAKTGFSKTDTVRFDPTSIGLPAEWSLTDWSDLKG